MKRAFKNISIVITVFMFIITGNAFSQSIVGHWGCMIIGDDLNNVTEISYMSSSQFIATGKSRHMSNGILTNAGFAQTGTWKINNQVLSEKTTNFVLTTLTGNGGEKIEGWEREYFEKDYSNQIGGIEYYNIQKITSSEMVLTYDQTTVNCSKK